MGLAISEQSFQAVSRIRDGERFTLVHPFREEPDDRGDAHAAVAVRPPPPSGGDTLAPVRLRTLLAAAPPDLVDSLDEEGLAPALPDGLEPRLDAVDDLLALSPDLAAIVCAAVAAIHPLSAPPGYDVSHSQPRWRERIFVSFPEREDEVGALRLAESVVHEAMHLHLTNEEARTPLVATTTEAIYSPWRGIVRAAQGLLHGVFVFSCVRAFLSTVASRGALGKDERRHLRGRIEDIEREMSEVDFAALETAMTPCGIGHLRRWREADGASDGTPRRSRAAQASQQIR